MSGSIKLETKGSFYGSDLTDLEAEKLFIERFGGGERAFKTHFRKELKLRDKKWYDYRTMHPVVATYLYAAEYRRVYRSYYSKTVDFQRAMYVKGFKGDDAWMANSSGGFIKGRQQADSMGIPYWFYIENAFEWLYRKKWKHIPRQTHLYNKEVIQFVLDAWITRATETLIVAELPFFKDQSNNKRPEYIAHQEWLKDRVSMSRIPEIATESLNERGYYF